MILIIILALFCALFFYVKDSVLRATEVETRILDTVNFEKHFDKPLDYLVDIGAVEFVERPTKYYKYFKISLTLTFIAVCLKVVSHVLSIL